MTSPSNTLQVQPISPALGAEITGADIRRDDDAEAVRAAFVEHQVVVVRNQRLTPEDQIVFARRFGPINVNRFFKSMDDHPQVALVIKEPEQKKAIGERWHTDHSYDAVPAMGSLLYAVQIPPSRCASTAGTRTNPMRCSGSCTRTAHGRSSAAGCAGRPAI